MGFGPFVLISLVYAVVGVRVVGQLVARRRETFDRRFTLADRALVDQAAFFVLVPVSVALHELGHAVAIWLLGGAVEGWGYYLFAGYVSFDAGPFDRAERVLVAVAGTVVNVLLAAAAVGLVFLRRPPMRAALNELLLQFAILSLGNALIVYPLLDLTSGLNGDWTQVYRGGAPRLAAAILAVHLAILAAGVWALRSDRVGARIAALTGAPPGTRRRPLGGLRRADDDLPAAGPERVLLDAAERVAGGWPARVETAFQRRAGGALLALAWPGGGGMRTVALWAPAAGDLELSGAIVAEGAPPLRRPLGRLPAATDADRLTLALRLAMETVDGWAPAAAHNPEARG